MFLYLNGDVLNVHTMLAKNMNSPLIKWTGSKRFIANTIIDHFPNEIDTYWEPFLGGGSVFLHLLKNNKNVNHYRLSDKNESLIDIFKIVHNSPERLIESYTYKWELLQKHPVVYYNERDYYNTTKDPLSFYFLTRTCYNGTIRYNNNGEFNTSLHFGRPGMHPEKVAENIRYYSKLMQGKDISFECKSFNEIHPTNPKDVVYLDPPYTNTSALYNGNISMDQLLNWINGLPCSWYMNLNGVNKNDNEEPITIPYTEKKLLSSGKSSFSRMKGVDTMVGEYFYYKTI